MAPLHQDSLQPRATIHNSLSGGRFSLDSSGIAGFLGFFGGDMAIRAMATTYLLGGPLVVLGTTRSYNMPGSFEMAQRFWALMNEEITLPQLLGLDGKDVGPKFTRRFGPPLDHTGHLALPFITWMGRKQREDLDMSNLLPFLAGTTVTVIDLPKFPSGYGISQLQRTVSPRTTSTLNAVAFFSFATTSVSLAACIVCALIGDWWNFSSISLGMVANTLVSFTVSLGGSFMLENPSPAADAFPVGKGIFVLGSRIVVIRGDEAAVNCLTRGRFFLKQQSDRQTFMTFTIENIKNYLLRESAKICSVLLAIQFIAQLILVPQGVLLGQIMFISTLTVSAAYNAYFASKSEKIQANALCDNVFDLTEEHHVRTFRFQTWTAMSTFACLSLQDNPNDPLPDDDGLSMVWDALLPGTTPVWRRWRDVVDKKLRPKNRSGEGPEISIGPATAAVGEEGAATPTAAGEEGPTVTPLVSEMRPETLSMNEKDKKLLDTLHREFNVIQKQYLELYR